jgi:hypothetical protein
MSIIKLDSVDISKGLQSLSGDIVGIIVPSKSGRDYPFIYNDYFTFQREFDDGEVDLSKYKFLFDRGYQVSAVRVTSEESNLATLRLCDKFTTNIVSSSPVYSEDLLVDLSAVKTSFINSDKPNYSNCFRITYNDINGSTIDPMKDFIYIPTQISLGNNILCIFFYNSQVQLNGNPELIGEGIYSEGVDLDLGDIQSQIRNILTNHNISPFKVVGGEGYDLYYSYDFHPSVSKYLSTNRDFKVEVLKSDSDDVLSGFNRNSKILELTSLVSGKYGSELIVKNDGNEFKIYYKDSLLEKYYYVDTLDLFYKLRDYSMVVDSELFDSTKELPIGEFKFGGLIEEGDLELNHYINAINTYADEYIDIDLLIYDLVLDDELRIIDSLNNASNENNFITLVSKNKLETNLNCPNLFFTFGSFRLNNIEYPISYLFFDLINSNYAGVINYNILTPNYDEKFYESLARIGLNHVRYDGYNYYIPYLYHNDETNYSYKFTLNRLNRRFSRLNDYIGTSKQIIHDQVLNIITELRSDTYLLEDMKLSRLTYDDSRGTCTIEVEFKLSQIIKEVLTLRIIINKN